MRLALPFEASGSDVLASFALISILLFGWWITGRTLRHRDDLSSQAAGRWTGNVRNALILIAVVGLLMIWAPQLRTFALSLTAVAVAIVIATKELILCLSGSAYRTFTQAYAIGDIIEVGTHRGQVKEINLLSTKMNELHGGEGSIRLAKSSVIVPHSLLFSLPARVQAKKGTESQHAFLLIFEPDLDLFSCLDEIREVAARACANLSRPSHEHAGVGSEPDLALTTTDVGKLRLEIKVMASPDTAEEIERLISNAVGAFVLSKPSLAKV